MKDDGSEMPIASRFPAFPGKNHESSAIPLAPQSILAEGIVLLSQPVLMNGVKGARPPLQVVRVSRDCEAT